ncbi:Ubiquitin carboxyl-terminal hydrolase 3 [Orbilia brochopaga]|uniref:Ubiquitin carboxyl-terminal hydrolase n=1 Tax=Orbilia brochopaga TaxID=3140254 RepID=A0AAV9UG16_9PEZI
MSTSTHSMAFSQYRRRHLFPPSSSSLHIHPFPSPPLTVTEPISPISQSSSSSSFHDFYPQTTALSSHRTSQFFFLDSQATMEPTGDIKPNGLATLRRATAYSPSDESAYQKIKSSMSLSVVLNAPSSTPPDCLSQTSEGAACGPFDGGFEESPDDGNSGERELPEFKSPPETPPQVHCHSHLSLQDLRPGTLDKLARAAEEDAEDWRHHDDKLRSQWAYGGVDATSSTTSSSTAASSTSSSSTLGSTTRSTPSRRLSLRSSQTVPPEVRKLMEEEEAERAKEVVPVQPRITLKFKGPSIADAPKPPVGLQPPVKRGRGRPRKHHPETGQLIPKKPVAAVADDQPVIKRRKLLSGAEIKRRQEAESVLSAATLPVVPITIDHALPQASADAIRPRKRRSVEEPIGHPHIHRKQKIVNTREERLPRPAMHEHSLGLSNLGATCYINVVVQMLAHTPALRDYFLACDFARAPADEYSRRPKAKPPKPKSQCVRRTRASEKTAEVLFPMLKGKLGEEFGKLIRELLFEEERKNGVASDQFWTALRANLEKEDDSPMDPNVVQDAHEFLILILEALAAEASPVVDGYTLAEIIDTSFAGTHATIFECNNCHATTRREDKCMELQVPICKKMPAHGGHLAPSSLLDHLANYALPEHGEWAPDAYVSPAGVPAKACPECGVDKGRSMRNTVRPKGKNVCIELKRFLWENGENRKVRGHVEFPLRDLDLSSCGDSAPIKLETDDGEPKDSTTLYDLYGVVVHKGDRSTTGHYIAFAKEGGQWLRFDDLKVHVVTEAEVARQDAYILMYEKQSVVA